MKEIKFFRNRTYLFLTLMLTGACGMPFMVGTLVPLIPLYVRIGCIAIIALIGIIIFFSKLVFVIVHIQDDGLKYTYFNKALRFVSWEDIAEISVFNVSVGLAITSWANIRIILHDGRQLILGVNEKYFHGLLDKINNEPIKQKLAELAPERWKKNCLNSK